MGLPTISALAAQAQTLEPLVVFDIVSVYDQAVLRISSAKTVFGGNTYLAAVTAVQGFQLQLENSTLGAAAIPEITLTLGNSDGTYSQWDNAHYFKNARITATFIFHDPSTGQAGSSDSIVVFKGICNAPEQVTDDILTFSAFNRFTSQLLLLPQSRISHLSQTVFPGEGKDDSDVAASTDPSTAAYAWVQSDSNRSRIDWPCGYGPMRGSFGFGGSNPLGNWKLAPVSAPDTHTATTIGKTGLGMVSGEMVGHFVIITSGTGAGQSRRIAANTSTVMTVANAFTTAPDGTSQFAVAYGYCPKSKDACKARGMFDTDSSSRTTKRFRGISVIPDQYLSRLYQTSNKWSIDSHQAKYNQIIPRVYGSCRVPGQIIFIVTDTKNLSGHILFCDGEISSLSGLIIEGKTIPFQQSPSQEQVTGSYTCVLGARGANATQSRYPGQDPYGMMAVVYLIILPLAFTGNNTDFQSSALVQGRKVETVDSSGNSLGWSYSDNHAWVLYDILKETGWDPSEIHLRSFHSYSEYANQIIVADNGNGSTTSVKRFYVSLLINQQRAVADVIAGLMGSGRMILSYDKNGLLRLDCENRLANTTLSLAISSTGIQFARVADGAGISVDTQLVIDKGTGSEETVTVLSIRNVGPIEFQANFAKTHSIGATVQALTDFDFDDSSIALDSNGRSTLMRYSQKTPDVPNEYTVEFFNSLRNNAQDSAVLLDTTAANEIGAKLTAQLPADGFPTMDAALRGERLALYKGQGARNQDGTIRSRGNLYVQFESTVKGILVRIGGIISITNAREGWNKKLFRVLSIDPSLDSVYPYWRIRYVAREHDDSWYDDINNSVPFNVNTDLPRGPSGPGGGGGTGGGTGGSGGGVGPIQRVALT